MPYFPRSPVARREACCSSVLPVRGAEGLQVGPAASVTPPSWKMLYGTQGAPLMQTGALAVPVTCSALAIFVEGQVIAVRVEKLV